MYLFAVCTLQFLTRTFPLGLCTPVAFATASSATWCGSSISFLRNASIFAYRSSSRLFRRLRLGSSWAGALRCAAVRLFIVFMCFWLTHYAACDVSPTRVVELWPLSIFTGLFRGASWLCASLVALYFPRRVSSPGHYFEGVAFHGFPFGIPKVQRFLNLVDLEKRCKMSSWTQKSAFTD